MAPGGGIESIPIVRRGNSRRICQTDRLDIAASILIKPLQPGPMDAVPLGNRAGRVRAPSSDNAARRAPDAVYGKFNVRSVRQHGTSNWKIYELFMRSHKIRHQAFMSVEGQSAGSENMGTVLKIRSILAPFLCIRER